MLTDSVAAAKEIIWERVATDKPMRLSDPRSMRLTQLGQRAKFLRIVVGDKEIDRLVRASVAATERLSNSTRDDLDRDRLAADQALTTALDQVGRLLQIAEESLKMEFQQLPAAGKDQLKSGT